MDEGWLSREGVGLHYLEWSGDGDVAPPVLLLHGLSSNARYWERTAAHLAGRRVIAFDQRGHGLTGRGPRPPAVRDGFTMDQLVSDAALAVTELALERPVVAGHSWGAAVALEFVARHPTLVSGLVFVDGPLQGIASALSWEEVQALMQPPLPRYASMAEAIADSRQDFKDAWADDLTPFVDARVMRDGDGWVLTLTSPIRYELLRGLYESRPEDLWRAIEVPAVVLAANHTFPRIQQSVEAGIERLREIAPSVEVKRFATPHDIPLYAPAEVAREIDRVAQQAAAARSTI